MAKVHASLWARLMASCVVDAETGCWLWTKALWRKYPKINVRIDGKHRSIRAHRIVGAIAARRPLDPVLDTIEHRCKTERCINPNHFLLATIGNNSASGKAQMAGRCDAHIPMHALWEDSGVFVHPTEAIPF